MISFLKTLVGVGFKRRVETCLAERYPSNKANQAEVQLKNGKRAARNHFLLL